MTETIKIILCTSGSLQDFFISFELNTNLQNSDAFQQKTFIEYSDIVARFRIHIVLQGESYTLVTSM